MADLSKEEVASVERMAEPASTEAEILEPNKEGEKVLCDKAKEEEKKEEPALPKLSAAEFRAYNSMAEHMEYFVRYVLLFLSINPSPSPLHLLPIRT